ncbi:MAG: hypothetical protein M3R49_07680 [Chloroflexota bacterium]|nr:hypothetical protein [Chloroflexota bacterium]
MSAVVLGALLAIALAPTASAHIHSKTIDTTTGECRKTSDSTDPSATCGSAVYGAHGFTGTLHIDAVHAPAYTIVDYVCVHTPSTRPFVSVSKGGMYTLTLYEDSGDVLSSATYAVNTGFECKSDNNAVVGGAAVGATVPAGYADLSIHNSVTIQGVTTATAEADFASYNSIRNRALDSHGGDADSESVKSPSTPPGEIPESPLSILLLATGGIGSAWVVARRMRLPPNNTLAS